MKLVAIFLAVFAIAGASQEEDGARFHATAEGPQAAATGIINLTLVNPE